MADVITCPLGLSGRIRGMKVREERPRVTTAFFEAFPERPGFQQNALTLYAWIAALATYALQAFSLLLPSLFHRTHPRTLRR